MMSHMHRCHGSPYYSAIKDGLNLTHCIAVYIVYDSLCRTKCRTGSTATEDKSANTA